MRIRSERARVSFTEFYELTDPLATKPFRLRSRLPEDGEMDGTSFRSISQGKSKIQAPIQFDAAQGSEATDILWTHLVTPVCVSNRVVRILEKNDVCGWSTYPVEVFDQEGKLHSEYHGFAVTGAVCVADYSLSTVISKSPPSPRGRSYEVYRGLYFDEKQWDGSDIFWVGGVRVVVGKVKHLFELEEIQNVSFVSLNEREIRVRHVRAD